MQSHLINSLEYYVRENHYRYDVRMLYSIIQQPNE